VAAPKGNKYAQIYTDEDLEKLGEEIIKFAEGKENVHWADFCRKKMKPISWLINLAVSREIFAPYYELANDIMAAKYSKAMLKNEWNVSFGEKYLPLYDARYKALKEWQAKLSQTSNTQGISSQDIIKAIADGSILTLMSQKANENK